MVRSQPELLDRIEAVLDGREEILEAYLFGSCARGEAGPISDIDVAVYVDEAARRHPAFGFDADLAASLMSALRTNAVDVVLLNQAPPLLYHRVLRDGVRLVSRDLVATTRREGQALSRYCDYVPPARQDRRGAGKELWGARPMNPGRVDLAVVRRHLLGLRAAVTYLRRHDAQPLEALTANIEAAWAVQRGLQLCAQNALDVATHLAASAGLDAPDYASAIDRLADMNVLPRSFAARFRAVAGFRNVLVHGYLDVDMSRVHRLLSAGLDDFETFASHVEHYLVASGAALS